MKERPILFNRDPYKSRLMRGDMVCFNCTNPAVGWVKRVAQDQSWADVEFHIDWGMTSNRRCERKDVLLINPILNKFVEYPFL